MGCCGSTNDDGDSDSNHIPYQMKQTYLQDSVSFWNTVEDLLQTAEDLRSGLEDNTDDMLEMADCDKLIDGNLMDAIRGWLWCMASIREGSILEWGLTLAISHPYFSINKYDKEQHHGMKFTNAFESYVITAIEGPKKIYDILKDAEELLVKANEMRKNLESEAKSSHLNPLQIVNAIKNFATNILTFETGLERMKRLKTIIEQAFKDIEDLIPNFPKMLEEANEIGKKCHEAGYKKPDDCLLHFIDQNRILQDEKLKLEKEDKKKKKKLKKQKKKEQKEAWLKQRGK